MIGKLRPRLRIAGVSCDEFLLRVSPRIQLPLLTSVEKAEPGMAAIVAHAINQQRWHSPRLPHLRREKRLVRTDPARRQNFRKVIGGAGPRHLLAGHAIVA